MLIWINTSNKWQLAVVLEMKPKLIQLPAEHVCRVHIRFKRIRDNHTDDTSLIDHVNWFPVSQKQFIKKCHSLKLPFFNYHGNFRGFRAA